MIQNGLPCRLQQHVPNLSLICPWQVSKYKSAAAVAGSNGSWRQFINWGSSTDYAFRFGTR